MIDLGSIDTVYKRRLRTITLTLAKDLNCSSRAKRISCPDDIHQVLHSIFEKLDADQEHFVMLVVSRSSFVNGYKVLFSGTMDSTLVDCKMLFRCAMLLGAHSICVAHNHPSHSPAPSHEDYEITKKIVHAGELCDIPLLDHIIYAYDGFTSIREVYPSLFNA